MNVYDRMFAKHGYFPARCPDHPDHAVLPSERSGDMYCTSNGHKVLPVVRDEEDRIGDALKDEPPPDPYPQSGVPMSDDLVLLSDWLAGGWERCNAHQQGLDCIRHLNHRTVDGAAIGPVQPTHGDPFLSPSQTNPTAGTPGDAAAQLGMARDLDRALRAREDEGKG